MNYYINVVNYTTINDSSVGGPIFIDWNNNGPYDFLFRTLKSYPFFGDLPEKYILNITTPYLTKDDIDLTINPTVLKDLQNGNAKILINRIGEFDSFEDGKLLGLKYSKLFEVLDGLNISRNNVLYLNFNSLVKEVCYNEGIKVKYHNFTQMNLYSIIKDKENEYREIFEHQKKSLKEYYYLCYNNSPKPHRRRIIDLLLSVESKGLLSSIVDGIFLDSNPPTKIESWSQNNLNLYYYVNQDHYRNSYFSIVTESHYSDSTGSLNLTFTEKTWKAITNFHPFCLVGAKNSLSKLREYGFETFPELFDEGYDDSSDEKRLDDITKEINGTLLLSISELDNIYYSMEEKLVHNFHHFFRLCENETKELEKYLLKFCNS